MMKLTHAVRYVVLAGWLVGMQASEAAAPAFPEQLTGSWATGESLYSGTEPQTELHLAADGFGMWTGSTSAPVRRDGGGDGKPVPRGIIGFPLQAEMDGLQLKLQLLLPQGQHLMPAPQMVITCSYQPDPSTLTCLPPLGKALVLSRRGGSLAPEAAQLIERLRRVL
ncbi:hypothetical protein [Duganella qianjiadongensis]|uniref:Uncharacterized protein n=1 Tax=Duganella qianjiadongensis TaxID=2692176 RepID=A0ABW9VKJ0_9BURK|nr:hypothetical protein [Duganella qianjiadongensis]MYM39948.1 hypothetical protein [Duganella qianjiadongensis]